MKLWDKGISLDSEIEKFTVGRDREMDLYLAPFDVLGSLAHIIMLSEIGLLTPDELSVLKKALLGIYEDIRQNRFEISEGVEDVHSQVEFLLTAQLGELGKKVHSGRSRNDQVLVDVKLFLRDSLREVVDLTADWFRELQRLSELHKEVLMPGYTHLQVAMPSSFGLWFGAYAESLSDDLQVVRAAWEIVNQNPLGSAAGYGSSFPLNRTQTTQLLGFRDLNYNVVYAQMGRGKTEKTVAFALSSLAATLSRFAMDACLYMSQNFGFISLPDQFTTGSSIMPHKKNPDVFELTRAKCNRIQSLPYEISLMLNNLPSGYFRDLQLLKEVLFPALSELKDCLAMMTFLSGKITVRKDILEEEKYRYLFSVEEVNRRVLAGIPFRDAYRQVGEEIRSGSFSWAGKLSHTHEGSIGNLCTAQIAGKFNTAYAGFDFESVDLAIARLTGQ